MIRRCWCVLVVAAFTALAGCDEEPTSFPTLTLAKYDWKVSDVSFDASGATLATASDEKWDTEMPGLVFWDMKTGQSKGGHDFGKKVEKVAYSKDGKRLFSVLSGRNILGGGDLGTLTVWDNAAAKAIFHIKGDDAHWVGEAAWAADGKTLATWGGNDLFRLWDVETGKELGSLEAHMPRLSSLALSPDGKLLAGAGYEEKTLNVWDVVSRKLLAAFPDHHKPVIAVAFSPDGALLASGGEDGNVILWDVSKLQRKATIDAHYGSILQIAFRPDGKQLAVAGWRSEAVADKGEEGAVSIFDVATGKTIQVLKRTEENCFCCLSFSPDGKLLAAGAASTKQPITVWEQDDKGAWKRKW